MSVDIVFRGNVGQDPSSHTFDDGNTVTTFSVGVNQGYYDQDNQWVDQGTMWLRVKPRSQQASSMIPHIHKGTKILVSGVLSQKSYTRKDGTQASSLEVAAQSIGLIPPKDNSTPSTAPARQKASTFGQKAKAQSAQEDPWANPSSTFEPDF